MAASQMPQSKGGFNYGVASSAGGASSLFGEPST